MARRPTRDRRDRLATARETASDLHDARVMEKGTLRRFDAMGLTPVEPLDAQDVSQA